MKILDTNIFLRNLTAPKTPQDSAMHATASALFARIADGFEDVTTIETVLHEVFYILCSNTGYAQSHAQAVRLVRPAVRHRSLHLARKTLILSAIEVFERNSKLDFTDCLLAVYAAEDGHELTTFDRDLADEAGVAMFGT
jgi:predicted nucleic acid-binding protein